jgi:hypothetical protein
VQSDRKKEEAGGEGFGCVEVNISLTLKAEG